MKFTHSKAARLTQLNREIVERVKEVQTLIRPGDDRCCLYLSNLVSPDDNANIVAASVGEAGIIAGLLVMQSKRNPHILNAVPQARELLTRLSE